MNEIKRFLEVGSKIVKAKNDLSVLAYLNKTASELQVTNIKEWLSFKYSDDKASGLYSFNDCKAFQELHGLNDKLGNEKFPEMPFSLSDIASVPVSKENAAAMLHASVCVSDDETRYFMNGIYFADGNVISTDGRRIYVALGFDGFPSVILPVSPALAFILKNAEYIEMGTHSAERTEKVWNELTKKADEKPYTVIDSAIFSFIYKDCVMSYVTSVIEGQFPNYKNILKDKHLLEMGVPDVAAWNGYYKIIKSLKKGDRLLVKQGADVGSVDIAVNERSSTVPYPVGSMKWAEFYHEEPAQEIISKIGKPEEPPYLLAINPLYFSDAVNMEPIARVKFTSYIKAIEFNYSSGAMMLVMPMQLD